MGGGEEGVVEVGEGGGGEGRGGVRQGGWRWRLGGGSVGESHAPPSIIGAMWQRGVEWVKGGTASGVNSEEADTVDSG